MTPLLLILNCFFIYFFRRWLGPVGIFVSSLLTILVIFFSLLFVFSGMMSSGFYVYFDFGRWFYVLDILDSNLIFVFDFLSVLSLILILLLSVFAQYFGAEYMYREAFIVRLLYLLNMFITSVAFLFIVFDFFLVLIVWELIGLFSLLLVNYYSCRVYTLKAALKTFVLSRLSDMFIFFSFVIFVIFFYSSDFSVLFLKIPFYIFYNIYFFNVGVNLLSFVGVLIALSGAVKAAQFLFHTWLPDAMEAPTPASALIHSSTLVIMGIYFVVRFNVLFEFSTVSNLVLALIGSSTIAFGAITATFQNDIKKLVAFSTISQMGYLFCGCGFLCYTEVMLYLSIHALNKAFLFIIVGYIVHFFNGNTDMRFMGSLYFYSLDIVFILFFISINLTGLPYSSGFVAKEFLLFQTFRDQFLVLFVRVCWFVSFLFTPIYMLLLNLLVLFYSRSTYVSLFNSISAADWLRFVKRGWGHNALDFSLIYSKLTPLVLFLFFLTGNFFGEYFLASLNGVNALSFSFNYASLSSFYSNMITDSVLFSCLLQSSISLLVWVFFASGLKYLFNFFRN